MGSIAKYRKRQLGALAVAVAAAICVPAPIGWAEVAPDALPYGESLDVNKKKGLGDIEFKRSSDGRQLDVTLHGDKGIIEWNKKFDVGSKATVNFGSYDGRTGWMVLNRIFDMDGAASKIYGKINGEGGTVFLVNPHGITFGAGAHVDVGSLVATTMRVDYDKLIAYKNAQTDKLWLYNKELSEEDKKSAITIADSADLVARDGYVAIFAHTIKNEGKITAPEVAMGYGNEVSFNYTDKINMQIKVNNGSKIDTDNKDGVLIGVKNIDNLIADSLIKNDGTIQVAKRAVKDAEGNVTLVGGNVTMAAAQVTPGNAVSVAGNLNLVSGDISLDKDISAGGHISLAAKEIKTVGGINAGGNVTLTADKVEAQKDIAAKGSINMLADTLKEDVFSDNKNRIMADSITLDGNISAGGDINLVAGAITAKDITSEKGAVNARSNNINFKNVEAADSIAMSSEKITVGQNIDANSNVSIYWNKNMLVGGTTHAGGDIKIRNGDFAKDKDIFTENNVMAENVQLVGEVSAGRDISVAAEVFSAKNVNAKGNLKLKTKDFKVDGNENISADKDFVMAAEKMTIDKEGVVTSKGNISLAANDMVVSGKLSAKGDIDTTATKSLQVRDSAVIDAHPETGTGTWNIKAKNVTITDNQNNTDDGKNPNRVSNTVISRTLADTNVNIVATPEKPEYYSDIMVEKPIEKKLIEKDGKKIGDTPTSLTFTAGRNISVDAGISSTAGPLDITLNSNNKENNKSNRVDGASIIRADISTNGGSFTATGDNGIYFGLNKEEAELPDVDENGKKREPVIRSLNTQGGDITLGGREVLVGTGGEVRLDAGSNGNVKIEGNVNSANAYYDGGDGKKVVSWPTARKNANGKPGETHLAVITGVLEDAVATSTITKAHDKNSQGYIGGHVVKVEIKDGHLVDKEKNTITVTRKGDVLIFDAEPTLEENYIPVDDEGKDEDFGFNKKGWYKIQDPDDATKEISVRFWAWTEGEEAGKIFFVQTKGENIELDDKGNPKDMDKSTDVNWAKAHGYAVQIGNDGEPYYINFTPKEPNDDMGQDTINKTQMALTLNYDTPGGGNSVLYSQWNDTCDSAIHVKHYVVEKELDETALKLNGKDVKIYGDVGNDKKLKDLAIDANGSIELGTAESGGSVQAVNKIALTAGRDVTLHNTLTAGAHSEDAIVIRAQERFLNRAADSAHVLNVDKENGGHWKVYSYMPYEEKEINGKIVQGDVLGELNSGQFAEWGKDYKSEASGKGDLFIFKYNPTLTFKANDPKKEFYYVGDSVDHVGYTVENELAGKFTGNFLDGLMYDGSKNALLVDKNVREKLSQVDTYSDGYAPGSAKPGTTITVVYGEGKDIKTAEIAQGYKNEMIPVAVQVKNRTVTPEPVKPEPVTSDESANTPVEPVISPETEPFVPEIADEPQRRIVNLVEKPQIDSLTTKNIAGSASYVSQWHKDGASIDRVLGLQSAELPVFNEKHGKVELYGTYDVTVDPDKVKMKPTAKVLPEPDQPENQYREYERELTTSKGAGRFRLTYNGSTFDIYPADAEAAAILAAGDGTKNVEVESQALFAAFNEMGITLDDLNGVYTHFEKKQ